MKKQTVWILPNNDKADNPVTWVDSANPQYTEELKGPFIEAEATIFNDARTVEFDDDAYSDSNAGCNTKTIVLDKLADIKGCKTIMSIDEQKIIKKKQPHSYIFLKKPTFDGEGGDKSSETDELDSCTISFTIEGTQGVMSDGGSYSNSVVWNGDGPLSYRGTMFNRFTFYFEGPDGQLIKNDDGKYVAFFVLLTKGHQGDVVNHGDVFFDDFSGAIQDDTHTPAYKVSSAIYGAGTYKYSRYSNLVGTDVSYTFDNNNHTATLQATIHHIFPVGTKIRMGLACSSSYKSSNTSSNATPEKVEQDFGFEILNGVMGEPKTSKAGASKIATFHTYNQDGGMKFFDPAYFSKSVKINFVNPNADNRYSVANTAPFDGGANSYYFPLGSYAACYKNNDLSEFTTYDNGLKPATGGLSTYNTPAWTFLGDIRRYTRGGKLCMKGTIRYLDYMADLQPVGSEYKDYKPFEIGI